MVPLTEKTLNRLEAEIIEFSDFFCGDALPEKLSSQTDSPPFAATGPGRIL